MRILTTHSVGESPATGYRDAVERYLADDTDATTVRIFAYAITDAGWRWLSPRLERWHSSRDRRTVELFVGLDNDASHPTALRAVLASYPDTSYVVQAEGVCFHPKAFLFEDGAGVQVFLGSNNLSRRGLSENFELGASFRVESGGEGSAMLAAWDAAVRRTATRLTVDVIEVYEEERAHNRALPRGIRTAGQRRAAADAETLRTFAPSRLAVVEALTETGGKRGRGPQLGLPWPVAHVLFGLELGGRTEVAAIGPDGVERLRKITYYSKVTYRLYISELATAKRPCVVVLQVAGNGSHSPAKPPRPALTVRYRVVCQSSEPEAFRTLYGLCQVWPNSTKRWIMLQESDRAREIVGTLLGEAP